MMILDKKGTSMFRLATVILIAGLVVFLAAPASLQAQRGGFGTSSGAVRMSPTRTSPARPSNSIIGRPVTPFVNPPVTGFGRAPVFGTSRVFPRSRGIATVPAFIPSFGYGGYYPYNYYSPFPGPVSVVPDPITQGYGYDYGYRQDQYAQDQAAAQNQADLTYEVSRLSQEVENLRQQQAMLAAPPPQAVAPVPVTPPVPVTATMLVFRDGHRMEIENYAVIGPTLWILDQRASTKIPLSDLDLEATQRENAARGMRFSVSSR
jgi:hypothetical protein